MESFLVEVPFDGEIVNEAYQEAIDTEKHSQVQKDSFSEQRENAGSPSHNIVSILWELLAKYGTYPALWILVRMMK